MQKQNCGGGWGTKSRSIIKVDGGGGGGGVLGS